MAQALVITLREGLEAFLIVAISLSFLRRSGRVSLTRAVYWGIGAAIAHTPLLMLPHQPVGVLAFRITRSIRGISIGDSNPGVPAVVESPSAEGRHHPTPLICQHGGRRYFALTACRSRIDPLGRPEYT